MVTSIGQYFPVFLPGETPWQRSMAGHSLQGRKELDMTKATLHTYVQEFFCPLQLCPSESWAWRWCSCLACRGPGSARCAGTHTASTTGVMALSVSFPASCSWRSEGLFGQSFSIALHLQALRGLPWLRSVSVWHVRPIGGAPWLESYSVDRCIRHLEGHPGWCPTL